MAEAPPPRLTSALWVSAYMARLRLAGVAHYLAARGDPTAGAVAVKLALMNGQARLFERAFDPFASAPAWQVSADGSEAEVDALIARQRARDPDLWVIEVEDRLGRSLLEEEGLS